MRLEEIHIWLLDSSNQTHPQFNNIKDEAFLCDGFHSRLHTHQITIEDIFEKDGIPGPILRRYVLELALKQNKIKPEETQFRKWNTSLFIRHFWISKEKFYEDTKADIASLIMNGEYPLAELMNHILSTKEVCPHDRELLRCIELSLEHATYLMKKSDRQLISVIL